MIKKQKQKPPYQVRMSEELYAKAQTKAALLGLSFAAYARMLISKDLLPPNYEYI